MVLLRVLAVRVMCSEGMQLLIRVSSADHSLSGTEANGSTRWIGPAATAKGVDLAVPKVSAVLHAVLTAGQ